MHNLSKIYIDGQWVAPHGSQTFDIVNPVTGANNGVVAQGDQSDVDRAVAAARRAFASYSQTSPEERLALVERIAEIFQARFADMVAAVSEEIGCPLWLAEQAQVPVAQGHIASAIHQLKTFSFEERLGTTLIRKIPIGVCALITPWNWPPAMLLAKTMPCLAAGCTMVLKPSEYAPLTAQLWTEILDAAGVPAGVFNMVFGDGPTVGNALSRHPDVDMISITGSTRAGIEVAKSAADTVKRVHQELGGKSPFVVLPDADLETAVAAGVRFIAINAGQTCTAPSRLLIHESQAEQAANIARQTAETLVVGAPDSGAFLGPVVNESQWNRVQSYIRSGIEEGAELLVGGPGKPEGLEQGFFVKPTLFAKVRDDMRIVREEIFGPVMVIQTYKDEDDAVRIANDTEYGLAAYVHSGSLEKARAFGARLRAGHVYLNGDLNLFDPTVPFGGCKRSGNGRENGAAGLDSYLEEVAFLGYEPVAEA